MKLTVSREYHIFSVPNSVLFGIYYNVYFTVECCMDEDEDEDEEWEDEEDGVDVQGVIGGDTATAVMMQDDVNGDIHDRVANYINNYSTEVLFPPLDGTAFYKRICKINHSCIPNVRVQYRCSPELGLVADMVSLCDIKEGEELVQSYIDQNMGKYIVHVNIICVDIIPCVIVHYMNGLIIVCTYSIC